MEIDGKSLSELVEQLKSQFSSNEEMIKRQPESCFALSWHTTCSFIKKRLDDLKLLQLTEEKRKLLADIVFHINQAAFAPYRRGEIFIETIATNVSWFVERSKAVNFAETIEQLEAIEKEIVEYVKSHPEMKDE